MYITQGVLAFLALYVGLAHCFSWDIVLVSGRRLEFYNEGHATHFERSDYDINRIAYDPVHNTVLLAHRNSSNIAVSSFAVSTKKFEPLIKKPADVKALAFDPPTETIFWVEISGEFGLLYSFSLKPGSNKTVNGNRLIMSEESLKGLSYIAVDSCGGYIYWMTDTKIEKARFDGSEREVVIVFDSNGCEKRGLAIDQQYQKLYWLEVACTKNGTENSYNIAQLNGQNRTTHKLKPNTIIKLLTLSNDFLYLGSSNPKKFWQISKIPQDDRNLRPKQAHRYDEDCDNNCDIAAKYTTQVSQSGEVVECPLPPVLRDPDYYYLNNSTDVSLPCVHGTKNSEQTHCECTHGYSGERCDVSVCHNYCFDGNCSVSAEGHPKCRCDAGYSGERCEVHACDQYCLENGVCSLNEKNEPVCQCTEDYEGERCDVPVILVNCFQSFSMLRDILNADLTPVDLGKGVKSTCAPTAI